MNLDFYTLPILRADGLDQIYKSRDKTLVTRWSHYRNFRLDKHLVPIVEASVDPQNSSRAIHTDRGIIQAMTSYGLMCLLEDIRARGYSELPMQLEESQSDKQIIIDHVHIGPGLTADEDILVEVRFSLLKDGCWPLRYYYMYIRYKISWKKHVLNILQCRV